MKRLLSPFAVSAVLLLALLVGACSQQAEPVHVVIDNAAELRPLAAPLPGPVGEASSRAAGDTNFTNLVASGYVNVGTFNRLTAKSAIAVTTNGHITPTGSYQPLTSSGNVATSNLTCGADGNVVVLVNESNTTITITDTGTLRLTGNIALGQFDSLTLLSDGTNCIQLATANN